MKQVTFNKSEIIFRQGDNASVMYDIISGKVGVFVNYQTGKEEKVAELEPGQTLGEMGMIEVFPRSATAVALEDGVELMELCEADFAEYFRDKPEKLLVLMREISSRIRETTRRYVDVCRVVSQNKKAEEYRQVEEQVELWREMDYYASFYRSYWSE